MSSSPTRAWVEVDLGALKRNGAAVAERSYALQRLVYALAAMRAGAREVEVVHVFLEASERPVSAEFVSADAERLGHIVDDLLTLARADAGQRPIDRQAVYLDDVALEAADAANVVALAKGVSLQIDAVEEAARHEKEGHDDERRCPVRLRQGALRGVADGRMEDRLELLAREAVLELEVAHRGAVQRTVGADDCAVQCAGYRFNGPRQNPVDNRDTDHGIVWGPAERSHWSTRPTRARRLVLDQPELLQLGNGLADRARRHVQGLGKITASSGARLLN